MFAPVTAIFAIMGVSLGIVCLSYASICRKDRSWVNWATLWFIGWVGGNYVLPFAYLLTIGSPGSLYAYSYCYATYAGSFLAAATTYCWLKPIRLNTSGRTPYPEVRMLPWILLAIGLALYLPILIEFRDLLLHPREIYTQTRTGYGLMYYGSAMFINLAFFTYLFKTNKTRTGALVFIICCATLVYLHGAKGHLLTFLMIWMLYRVYVEGKVATASVALRVGGAIALLVVSSFVIFSTNVTGVQDLVETMSAYSDYSRNAIKVIDDHGAGYYGGRLTLENEFYSHIPRAILPNKPKDFGEFALAKKYYPDWFYGDTGSPSFGIGLQYADFGPFAVFFIMAWSALTAWAVKSLAAAIRSYPHPSYVLLLLFFAGLVFIPSGQGYVLPETLLIALGMAYLLSVNVRIV